MGQIKKVGDVYYIEFYARGLMYSQVAGPDLEAAQKLLETTEAKIAQGEALTIVREIDLPAFFERFIQEYEKEWSQKTIGRFKDLIGHFSSFLSRNYPSIQRLSQVTPSVCESYKVFLMKSLGPKRAKRVNFAILLLRELLEYGIRIGFINDNPTIHVRLLKLSRPAPKEDERTRMAQDLFRKGIGFGKIYQILGLSDIGKMMYYANLIPLSREDMYN